MRLIRSLLGRCSHCGGAIERAPVVRHKSITRCGDCGVQYCRRGVLRRWSFIIVVVSLLICLEYAVTRSWADVGTDRFFWRMSGWQLLDVCIAMWLDHILRFCRIRPGECSGSAPSA